MSNSIIYEHDELQFDSKGFADCYKLVQWNGQTISVAIENSKIGTLPKSLIIKNLDTTNILVKWLIDKKHEHKSTEYLDVFMYSNSILFIGLGGSQYSGWTFDFTKNQLKQFSLNYIKPIRHIIPVGQNYFMLLFTTYGSNVEIFKWDNLLNLNNLPLPVYIIDGKSRIYSINWSSSAIEHLSSVEFVQTFDNSEHVILLDKNFNLVMCLNVQDLFPNYLPDESIEYNKSLGREVQINKIITANTNCLLYFEYLQPHINSYNNVGKTNIYCWDFTSNSQVMFANYTSSKPVLFAMPFRNVKSNSKIKYMAQMHFSHDKDKFKIFESTSTTSVP
jgi:hypothetical protein